MRNLGRHLFTLCSAVSLALCVAVGVLWVLSTWAPLDVALDHRSSRTRVWAEHQHGKLYVRWREIQPLADGTWDFTGNHIDATLCGPAPNRFGFGWNRQPVGPAPRGGGGWTRVGLKFVPAAGNTGQLARAGWLSIPYWPLLLITALGPTIWVIKRVRARRSERTTGFDVVRFDAPQS